MSGFGAMFRKEICEQIRTFRLPVVLVLFLMVGLASPLLAKLMPDLLGALSPDQLGGFELLLTKEPGVADALFQYQKNFALLPIAVVLMAMGAVSGERRRGTAPLVLVKPVSRRAFLLAKMAAPATLYLVGTVVSGLGCLLYTTILFGELYLPGYLALNGLLLLALLVYLAITLLASVIFPSTGAAAVGLASFALFSGLGALPVVGHYTPGGLLAGTADLVLGRDTPWLGLCALISGLLVVVLLIIAERLFAAQEL